MTGEIIEKQAGTCKAIKYVLTHCQKQEILDALEAMIAKHVSYYGDFDACDQYYFETTCNIPKDYSKTIIAYSKKLEKQIKKEQQAKNKLAKQEGKKELHNFAELLK
jgi:hypothetical protein